MPRSRFRGHSSLASFLFIVPLVTSLVSPDYPAKAQDRTLLLAVELNGRPLDVMVEADEREGALELLASDLPAVGLRRPTGAGTHVRLQDLVGVTYRIDERRQTLVLQADDRPMMAQKLQNGTTSASDRPTLEQQDAPRLGTGALLNYNVLGTTSQHGSGVNGLFDLRAFSPYGVVSTSALARQDFGTYVPGQKVVRLDTVLTETETDGMRRWRFGDVITSGLAWTRPFRLAGAQVTSDFSIRPDLVTFPLPELDGRVGVPSTVDVLVNGVRQLSQQVQPGPFELRQPPVVTGAGDIAVVVRDATGRETVRNLAFYASPVLLQPGLWSYGLEGGLVRTAYGLTSDGYTKPALTGTARYGVSNWLTAEAHAEGTGQLQMGGVGLAMDVAGQALLSGSVATSRLGRRGGMQASIGLERSGRVISLSGSITRATRGFQDVPALNGNPVTMQSMRAGIGLSLGYWGSLNGAFIAASNGLLAQSVAGLANADSRVRLLSVSYSRPVTETVSFYATGYRDFGQTATMGLNAGFTVALGPRRSANLSGGMSDGRPDGLIDVAQAAVGPGDIGWRASAEQARVQQQQAEATMILPWGTASVGGEHVGGSFDGRAGMQGALVLAGHDLFAANKVEDSFAVVDTGGMAGVQVLRENRVVGRTNAAGQILVPDLRGWDANRISIDPSTMPGDVELGSLQQVVRPQDHTGVAVGFVVKRGRSALILLVEAGQPVPAGSTATVTRTGHKVPVGNDGEIFLNDLEPEETVQVTTSKGRCQAQFRFKPVPGDIPVIGPVSCERLSE